MYQACDVFLPITMVNLGNWWDCLCWWLGFWKL